MQPIISTIRLNIALGKLIQEKGEHVTWILVNIANLCPKRTDIRVPSYPAHAVTLPKTCSIKYIQIAKSEG